MISFLRGTVTDKLPDSLILDVHGVGYEVRVTPRLWQGAATEAQILIYTHFHVREDVQVLFGFSDLHERDMFRTLLTVSGVGPKTAMAVLSVATSEDIIRAVQREDVAALKAPGVGPKIVKRLISELKTIFEGMKTTGHATIQAQNGKRGEIVEALVQLDYTEREVLDMLEGIDIESQDVQSVIKLVLRNRAP